MATARVTVKRASMSGGRKEQAAASEILTDLACTHPTPLDTNQSNALAQEPTVKSIFNVYQTYVLGVQDIRQGDIAEIDSVSYTVKAAAKWPQGRNPFTQVTMERLNP